MQGPLQLLQLVASSKYIPYNTPLKSRITLFCPPPPPPRQVLYIERHLAWPVLASEGDELRTNYSHEVSVLLREIEVILRMGLPVPIVASALLSRRQYLVDSVNSVQVRNDMGQTLYKCATVHQCISSAVLPAVLRSTSTGYSSTMKSKSSVHEVLRATFA